MYLKGNIISGEFDEGMNEFSIQKVKHFNIESTIKENQLTYLYRYLKDHLHEDGQIITLYDQMPVHLTQEEMNGIIQDLEKIQSMYQ